MRHPHNLLRSLAFQRVQPTGFVLAAMMAFTRLCVSLGGDPTAEDWPQWRGPDRDSRVDQVWPERLQGAINDLWSVKLGPGYSGPIIVGDRVFVAETKAKKTEIVRALDRKTGEQDWACKAPRSICSAMT